MSQQNGMPKPEVALLALAMVVAAVAQALPPRRRSAFLSALEDVASTQESARRIVPIQASNGNRRAFTMAVNAAATFVAKIVAQLRAVHE